MLALTAAVFASAVGGPWDISWHLTIGRDTFWTPAHLAIYLGGATAGFVCGWLAIRTTFIAAEAERRASIRIFGGRAPYGAWIVIWGAVAMLTAGPFDNWWHDAYGLDVKIISPPHVVLFLGGVAIRLGAWLLVLREQNRGTHRIAAWLFCILGGLLLEEWSMIFTAEFWPNRQHSALYVVLACTGYPFLLAAIARASKLRWGATAAATTYMLFVLCLIWILPRFAAEPRLGPIYHRVTHMVNPPFPQWLILPAIAIDLLKQRWGLRKELSGQLGFIGLVALVFVGLFLPTQWFFSHFYLTPAADNAFFGGNRIWGYASAPAGDPILTEFWAPQNGFAPRWIACAFIVAAGAVFLGRGFGSWMEKVKR